MIRDLQLVIMIVGLVVAVIETRVTVRNLVTSVGKTSGGGSYGFGAEVQEGCLGIGGWTFVNW